MDASALKPSIRHRLPGVAGPASWATAGATAVWTIAVAANAAGALTAPNVRQVLALFPVALLGAAIAGRRLDDPAIRASLAWTAIVLAALVGAKVLEREPMVAYAAPAVLLAALAVARWPAAAAVALFALTGAYGSLEAFLGLPVGLLVDLIIAGLAAAIAVGLAADRPFAPPRLIAGAAALALYVLLTAGQVLVSPDPVLGLQSFRASTWYLLAGLLIGYGIQRRVEQERMLRGMVLVALAVGAYATLRWIIGPSAREADLAIVSANRYNTVGGELRLIGSFPNGQELGVWTAVALPFLTVLTLTLSGRWRMIAALAAGLCTVGLLGSELRVGLVAVAVGLALVLVLFVSARGFGGLKLGGITAVIATAVIVGGAVYSMTVGRDALHSERYARILEPGKDQSFVERSMRWSEAWRASLDKPFGHGIGTAGRVEQRYGRFRSAGWLMRDSSYLFLALQQGVAMMFYFVAAALALVAGLGWLGVTARARLPAGVAIGACGALAAFLVTCTTGPFIEGLPALATWIIVGAALGQHAVRRPREAEPA